MTSAVCSNVPAVLVSDCCSTYSSELNRCAARNLEFGVPCTTCMWMPAAYSVLGVEGPTSHLAPHAPLSRRLIATIQCHAGHGNVFTLQACRLSHSIQISDANWCQGRYLPSSTAMPLQELKDRVKGIGLDDALPVQQVGRRRNFVHFLRWQFEQCDYGSADALMILTCLWLRWQPEWAREVAQKEGKDICVISSTTECCT